MERVARSSGRVNYQYSLTAYRSLIYISEVEWIKSKSDLLGLLLFRQPK
jgi:hypothetical protein